jgi:thiol-disulfide isomerase/thioredoxin
MALVRIAAASALLNAVVGCDQVSEPVTSQFVEGREFPPALLAVISGEGAAAESLRGKMLVLNVWATWCTPCRQEMPSLNRLSKMLDPQKFAVVGVSTDADALLVSEFLLQNGIAYPNFLDLNGKVVRQLGLRTYPETFVIAPDRILVRRLTGWREWSSPEMVRFIEGLYPAQPGSGSTRPDVLR